jgi:hypothetical protein
VEWLKVKALSASPSTAKKKKRWHDLYMGSQYKSISWWPKCFRCPRPYLLGL